VNFLPVNVAGLPVGDKYDDGGHVSVGVAMAGDRDGFVH